MDYKVIPVVIVVLAAFGVTSVARSSDTEFYFPTTGVKVDGQAILLAIDDHSLAMKKDLCFYLTKPNAEKNRMNMCFP